MRGPAAESGSRKLEPRVRSASSAEGLGRWTCGPGSRTGLTRHELVRAGPLFLIVMQGPQIDDDLGALVHRKLADAARTGKGEAPCSRSAPPHVAHLRPSSPLCPHSHGSLPQLLQLQSEPRQGSCVGPCTHAHSCLSGQVAVCLGLLRWVQT